MGEHIFKVARFYAHYLLEEGFQVDHGLPTCTEIIWYVYKNGRFLPQPSQSNQLGYDNNLEIDTNQLAGIYPRISNYFFQITHTES